jgi:hypothetical protein
MSRLQKPWLRDFLLDAQTRSSLCINSQTFIAGNRGLPIPKWRMVCQSLTALHSIIIISTMAPQTLRKCSGTLSKHQAIQSERQCINELEPAYFSGSGKSSALTPHINALIRTLA